MVIQKSVKTFERKENVKITREHAFKGYASA